LDDTTLATGSGGMNLARAVALPDNP